MLPRFPQKAEEELVREIPGSQTSHVNTSARPHVEKKGKPTSHRYNRLPLLPSGPGGVQQELVVPTCLPQK
jgi:hypothetical protein